MSTTETITWLATSIALALVTGTVASRLARRGKLLSPRSGQGHTHSQTLDGSRAITITAPVGTTTSAKPTPHMNAENIESKVAMLEKTVGGLVELQQGFLNSNIALGEQTKMLLQLYLELNACYLAIARLFVNPIIPDDAARQRLLDIIAKSETKFDQMQAMFANLNCPKTSLPPNPPTAV